MKVGFSYGALSQLENLETYLKDKSVSGYINILKDILAVADMISIQPELGRLSENKSFRSLITPKYRYTVSYEKTETRITIIDIRKYQQPL